MNIWNVVVAILVLIGCILIFSPINVVWGVIAGIISLIIILILLGLLKVNFSPFTVIFVSAIIFISLSALVFSFAYEVPPELKTKEIKSPVREFLRDYLGIPDDWLYTPAIFYLFVVPFIGLWGIVEGIMNELKEVFPAWAIHLIAFSIAFCTIPLGIFSRMVQNLFAVFGLYSVGIFGVLFFFAALSLLFRGLHKTHFTPSETYQGFLSQLKMEEKYKKLETEAQGLISQLRKAEHIKKRYEYIEKIVKSLSESDKKFYEEGKFEEACVKLSKTIDKIKSEIEKS